MAALHEIQIDKVAIKPQVHGVGAKQIIDVCGNLEFIFYERNLLKIVVWLENRVYLKDFCEGIRWGCRQFVTDSPTELHFNRKGFCSSEVREKEFVYRTSMPQAPDTLLIGAIAELADLGSNNCQFDSNSRIGRSLSGTGGDARRTCNAYRENAEDSSEDRDDNGGTRGYFVPVFMNEMADGGEYNAAKSGTVFFELISGFLAFACGFWFLIRKQTR